MNLNDYEEWVNAKMSSMSMKDFEAKLSTAGLGLAGEGGECADIVKKVLFHGLEFNEEIRNKFIKELGDILFYVAFAAKNVCNIGLQEVIDQNVEKLNARYKKGFSVKEFLEKESSKT